MSQSPSTPRGTQPPHKGKPISTNVENGRSATSRRFASLIPTSWLDQLLTGPDAVLKGTGPWGCPDIERLLLAIKKRISEAK